MGQHNVREHDISLPKRRVVALCAQELPEDEKPAFKAFTDMLSSLLHHRFRTRIDELKEAFDAFDPDAAAISAPQSREHAAKVLVDGLQELAEEANFTLVGDEEFGQALKEHTLLKVRIEVNSDQVDRVILYRRGSTDRTQKIKRMIGIGSKTVEFVSYDNVLVVVAFRGKEHFTEDELEDLHFEPGSMMIKMFQDVPEHDLEMVLPNVDVHMRLIDKLMIGVPAVVSGIVVIVTKLIASLGVLFLLIAFWLGLRDQPVTIDRAALVTIGAGLAAFGGYLWRQFSQFKNRKIEYMKVLSESLYFRNVANDVGVFQHMVDAAEESTVSEALLCYHFLRKLGPMKAADLRKHVEDWLLRRSGERVAFDVDEGLRTLQDLRLSATSFSGVVSVVDLDDGCARMDEAWDAVFGTRRARIGS